MWSVCLVLTLTNVLEEGHPARTDARLRVLKDSAWLYIPYPGQFGWPTVTVAGLFIQNIAQLIFNPNSIVSKRCSGNVGGCFGVYS